MSEESGSDFSLWEGDITGKNLEFIKDKRGTEPLRVNRQQALIAQYTRGYWLTRYLEETQPQLLRDLLSRRIRHKALEAKIASAFGKEPESIWQGIDGDLCARYR